MSIRPRIPAVDRPAMGRVTEIHTHPCAHCPSTGEPDPETLDFMIAPRREQIESVFPCGWRNTKACKAYCDRLGVSEADLRDAFGGES